MKKVEDVINYNDDDKKEMVIDITKTIMNEMPIQLVYQKI